MGRLTARAGAVLVLVAVSVPVLRAGSLEGDLQTLLRRHHLKSSQVGVAVCLEGSDRVLGLNVSRAFKPASTLKVLTVAAALFWLGLDHEYVTTVRSTGPLAGNTIAGDLIVHSTGDPNISGRFYGDDPTALLRQWARGLYDAGLRSVTGRVLADASFFDDVRFLPSWDRKQESRWYCAQISAVNLNDNCLDVTVTPAAEAGTPAEVVWVPASSLVEVRGEVKTTAKGTISMGLSRTRGTNRIRVWGKIPRGTRPWKGNVTVDDPALFFADVFTGVLREQGIAVRGKPGRLLPAAGGRARPAAGGRTLVRHTSTLRQDLPVINKRSQNLHAEILLKALGVKVHGEGSAASGARAVKEFLRAVRIPSGSLAMEDGSGLSHGNRATAGQLARALRWIRSRDAFDVYRLSLPVAGVDGTLRKRFSSKPGLKGRVFGKTGHIRAVSCLSGYVVRDGRAASFSVLVNGIKGSYDADRFQEEVAERVFESLKGSGRKAGVR